MADYFGVEFPSPFDKEYVDPASARTVARLLQEDMSGKCFPPGASLNDLEYDPADAVAIARMLEEDEMGDLTSPQYWDAFDSSNDVPVHSDSGSGVIANKSIWSLREPNAAQCSPIPCSKMNYPVRGNDSGGYVIDTDTERALVPPAAHGLVPAQNPARRFAFDPFGSSESTPGSGTLTNENSSENRQPSEHWEDRATSWPAPPIGFAREEGSLAPPARPKLAPAVRSSISLMFDECSEPPDHSGNIAAWIDGVNSSYRIPTGSASTNQVDSQAALAQASATSLQVESTLTYCNTRQCEVDNEQASSRVGVPTEQMASRSPQDTFTDQPHARMAEDTHTDSDDMSPPPQGATIGRLPGASASTDTIRIGNHESLSPSGSESPSPVPSVDKGKQRAAEPSYESGNSSESEWSMMDDESDDFLVVTHRSASSIDTPLVSQPRDTYQKPLELEKCLLCKIAFEYLNDLSQSLQDRDSAPVGTRLQCPQRHAYCAECIVRHFYSNLANGSIGISDVSCPDCTVKVWRFDEQEAGRVLAPLYLE